jgi:hypothetical protein
VSRGEDGCGPSDLDKVKGVDDADAAAFIQAEDGLCVLEVGVHFCVGIDEPCAQVFAGVI